MEKELTISLELWNSLKNYVPVKERQPAADHFFNTIVDAGIDVESFKEEIQESCDYIFKSFVEYMEQIGDHDGSVLEYDE